MVGSGPVYILDSYAMLAYLAGEPGKERVKAVLNEAAQDQNQLAISIINLGEVLYITERERSLARAQLALAMIDQLPIEIAAASRESVLSAAHIKAHFPVAYADAFAIALAEKMGGTILTGDPEFEAVEELVNIERL